MMSPDCTDHGSLILDYVRGDLGEAEGLHAEMVLSECPDCQAWMNREFSGPAFEAVDNGVGHGLDTVSLPNRRQRFGWITAAAAIVVVAGGLTLLQLPHQSTPMAIDQVNQDLSTQIVTFDFEGGNVRNSGSSIEEKAVTAEVIEADALFTDDLEDGGAGSWTIHT